MSTLKNKELTIKRFIQGKPEECPICYESLKKKQQKALECGHWSHFECLICKKS